MITGIWVEIIREMPEGRFIVVIRSNRVGRTLYRGNAFTERSEAIAEAEAWFRENEAGIIRKIRFD